MIGKVPRNYSNDFDRRKQRLDEIASHILPDVTTEDAGKIMKVSEDGAWTLGKDESPILPIVTSSDSGKFLQARSGKWALSGIKMPQNINFDKYYVKTKASNQSLVFEEYPFDIYRIMSNGKFRNEDGDALTYSEFLELEGDTKFYIINSPYGGIITKLYDVPKDDSLTGECYICLSFPYINSADGTPITKTYRATFDDNSLNNEVVFTLLS